MMTVILEQLGFGASNSPLTKTRQTISVANAEKIGEGGMGSVWQIGNAFGKGDSVIKLYHRHDDKTPTEEKLWAMIQCPPDHVQEVINGVCYTQFAWPTAVVKNSQGEFIGFAMPELDFNQSISLNPFIYPREAVRLTPYQNSLNYRVQLGANISALMADLHRHGHAFIDFKEQNLRLMPEPADGRENDYKGFIVGFIDCDSFLITGSDGQKFPCTVISPEMTSPEYHLHKNIALLDEKHDRFVLAIELFKILNFGIHPFYFIPLSERLKNLSSRVTDNFIKEGLYAYGLTSHPEIAPLKSSIHVCWDDGTRQLFDRAFTSQNPADRPTAQEWENHLRSLSSKRQFTVCERFPEDISHIHFIGKTCYRCLLDGLITPQTISHPANSVWQSVATSNEASHPTNEVGDTIGSSDINFFSPNKPSGGDSDHQKAILADTQYHANATPAPIIQPIPLNGNTNAEAKNEIPITPLVTPSISPVVATSTVKNTSQVKPKTDKKWWLIPAVVLGMGGLGVGFSQVLSSLSHEITKSNVDGKSKAKTTESDDDNADLTSFAGIMKNLPDASKNITTQLAQINAQSNTQSGVNKRLTARSASAFYENTLDIPADFFAQVVSLAGKGEGDLTKLQTTAFNQDIQGTQALSTQVFRSGSLNYFDKLPTNKALAKQLNDTAKTYYWQKNNPVSALYLQAQAVKNQPTQSEYVANLAFYLSKNNFPYTKEFMLYALQTPRDPNKYANTFMLETAAGLAAKEGNQDAAVGSLLAQFYTVDDPDKRCTNMLKYPQIYPELVPSAKQALAIITEQHNQGVLDAPTSCLPPYNWAN